MVPTVVAPNADNRAVLMRRGVQGIQQSANLSVREGNGGQIPSHALAPFAQIMDGREFARLGELRAFLGQVGEVIGASYRKLHTIPRKQVEILPWDGKRQMRSMKPASQKERLAVTLT